MHMKKLSFFAFVLVALSAVYFVACQKEAVVPAVAEATVTDQISEERSAPLEFALTSLCVCGDQYCTVYGAPTAKRNALKFTVTPSTHSQYNLNGPGITYTIYSGNSCSGIPIASFLCNKKTVVYANSQLVNGGQYSVRGTSNGGTSTCYTTQVGNCNGLPCDISN